MTVNRAFAIPVYKHFSRKRGRDPLTARSDQISSRIVGGFPYISSLSYSRRRTGFLPWWTRFSKLWNMIILHMILQVVASFSRIKTSRKGEGLGFALNQTKGRENEVFWQNQNVYQLKKNLSWCQICQHLQPGKQTILHTSYLTSE